MRQHHWKLLSGLIFFICFAGVGIWIIQKTTILLTLEQIYPLWIGIVALCVAVHVITQVWNEV